MRITSAPICASVMPPSGAATKAAASTTRRPASTPRPMSGRRRREAERTLHEVAGNDLECQRLLRALEDRQHPRIDEIAAHRGLLRVAHAAVQLQRLARDQLGGTAGQQL